MPYRPSRREFAASTGATALALTTASAAKAETTAGPNDVINLGFIGVGNRGTQVMEGFRSHKDCRVVAICDVDQRAIPKALKTAGGKPEVFSDFRRVIQHPDVDAVVIATPDHWHAIQCIQACEEGKDVYVEKPLSLTIVEGRKMVEAARRNKRVVQVGTHRRSSPRHHAVAKRALADEFGKICMARAYRLSNMTPGGIGKQQPKVPPKELDWDMWLGPQEERAYQANITPYKFRWWRQYSSQMGNWGVHYLDAIRWCMGEEAPSSICAMGGGFAVDDDRTIPDTLEACFQFASGRMAVFGQYETSGASALRSGEVELRGTRAAVYIGGSSYEVLPERRGQFQDWRPSVKEETVQGSESNALLTSLHTRNFLNCIRTRKKPNADVEIGHRSTSMSLLANISLQVGKRLEWDAANERFTNCDEANELLHYEYRNPWKLT